MEAIQPASLSFLSIYNPALGRTDETLHEQVVYHYATNSNKSRNISGEEAKKEERQERNERLRQIGLAQGMVEFAKAFSDGQSVDAIDAEKSRILLHELEPGWWMLASVELTQIHHSTSSKSKSSSDEPTVEYSTREVSSQDLLLKQLLRAHSVFLLHHAPTLSDLWIRLSRQRFCRALEKFWNKFLRDWDVLLHGNPATDIYNGLNLSAGGELGIGVGEEEWGSGEREVLEGFIDRTEGLVDVVVARYGDITDVSAPQHGTRISPKSWLGSGESPSSTDGVVFSGVGAVTRSSLRDLSAWMDWIYKYGTHAFGVSENPGESRRRRRHKPPVTKESQKDVSKPSVSSPREELPPGIPPPIVRAAHSSLEVATRKLDTEPSKDSGSKDSDKTTSDTMLKYMTLGIYGSSWGIQPSKTGSTEATDGQGATSATGAESAARSSSPEGKKAMRQLDPKPDAPSGPDVENGCFLIGLQGSLDEATLGSDDDSQQPSDVETDASSGPSWARRNPVRTLYVELDSPPSSPPSSPPPTPRPPRTHPERLRVLVYARRPFLFTFLFYYQTPTLGYSSFYRSLHHQLGPLQKPLLFSTSPSRIHERKTHAVSTPRTLSPTQTTTDNPIFDLLWDPHLKSITSTLPPIPEPGTLAAEGLSASVDWSRMDVLNVHSTIISIIKDTRHRPTELERTVKTSKGWWVVWMRLPPEKRSSDSERTVMGEDDQALANSEARRGELEYREAILVRRASDHPKASSGKKSWMGGAPKESAWGSAGKVVEGIGIDARRYVEGLLSLNR